MACENLALKNLAPKNMAPENLPPKNLSLRQELSPKRTTIIHVESPFYPSQF